MFTLYVGRWTFDFINPECIGYWTWKRSGYDCLWDEYAFGFWLVAERETDYLAQLAEDYPPPPGTPKRPWLSVGFSWPDFS